MAANEGERWLVGTSLPVIIAALGAAVAMGILYNTAGRTTILEADLTQRNIVLPANSAAERIRSLEEATRGLPAIDAKLSQQVASLHLEVSRLNGIAERGVLEWNDAKSRLAAAEAEIKDLKDRGRRLRDDLNAHREADDAVLRDRLRDINGRK